MSVRDTAIGSEVIAAVSPVQRDTAIGSEVIAAVKNSLRDTMMGAEFIVRLGGKSRSFAQVVI